MVVSGLFTCIFTCHVVSLLVSLLVMLFLYLYLYLSCCFFTCIFTCHVVSLLVSLLVMLFLYLYLYLSCCFFTCIFTNQSQHVEYREFPMFTSEITYLKCIASMEHNKPYTTLTNLSTKYLVMCNFYTDVGGIK